MEAHALILLLLVFLPFIGSLCVAMLPSTGKNTQAIVAGTIAFFCFLYSLTFYPSVKSGGVIRFHLEWLSEFGLNFSLRMDGLGWVFSLLITGIGLLVVIYGRYYLSINDPLSRFFSYLLAFMGSMLGIVLSSNLLLLFVFWELTSLFSFLLVGFWSNNARAREGARMALSVTFIGGLCLLLSILLIGYVVGSFEWDMVVNARDKILEHPLFLMILLCLLVACLTKSAQFPFHFWLPQAMTAPTPASAYLHSATLVKAGVFLLARFWPIFSDTAQWFWILGIVGLSSLVFGAIFAMFQQDLKALLAYSTISHLGLIVTLLSLGSPLACVAAVFHILNHATFKSSLFMAAGIIEHEAGTRDLRLLSGLYRAMPITGTLAFVASAAMAGVPLLNGFLSKEMFFTEAALTHRISWLDTITPYVAIIAGLFSVVYSIRFVYGVFLGPKAQDLPQKPHEPPYFMRLPVEFLVFLCIIVGIVPNWAIKPFLEVAVVTILHSALPTYDLALWHGWDMALWMSIIALVGGVIAYVFLRNILKYRNFSTSSYNFLKGRIIFTTLIDYLMDRCAPFLVKVLSAESLQKQLRIVLLLGFAFIISFYNSGYNDFWQQTHFWQNIEEDIRNMKWSFDLFTLAILWTVGAICAIIVAIYAKFHRFSAILFLGGVGLAICTTFLFFSAPDVALTQLLVEIVTTILLLLCLRWLPQRLSVIKDRPYRFYGFYKVTRRTTDFILAILAGLATAFFAYQMMKAEPNNFIGQYYLENAYKIAKGQNVVNVMLVDFRAFDTLGEICVLVIVALTIYGLLRRFRPAIDSIIASDFRKLAYKDRLPQLEPGVFEKLLAFQMQDQLAIMSVISRWLFPIITVVAIFFILRGHNLPGGGFAAGIVLAIGFILQYLILGTRWVESHLRILPMRWMGLGLFFAFTIGMVPWFFSYSYLTNFYVEFSIPFLNKIHLSSALVFDNGVFLIVVGATVLILIALAHQSLRGYRLRIDEEKKEYTKKQEMKNIEKQDPERNLYENTGES